MVRQLFRITLFVIYVALLSACATAPTPERREALFWGRVLSVESLGLDKELFGGGWALWRVEIDLVGKVYEENPQRVSAYYLQNFRTNYVDAHGTYIGSSHSLACGSWPRIRTNVVHRFNCVRRDVGQEKGVCYIEQALSK